MKRSEAIRNLADLIEHLEPDAYAFLGHYWPESQQDERKYLEFNCEFVNDTQAVVVSWEHSNFELRILFATGSPNSAPAHLFIRGLGYIKGEMVFVDRNVLFTARNDVASVFGHLTFDGALITITGTFETKGERLVYVLNGSVSQGPLSLANVQSIGTKRA